MLHITESIELAFRKREGPFSADFWKGLGLALALHITLFFAFQIVSPYHQETLQPLLPIDVEIYLGEQEKRVLSPIMYSSPIETLDPPSPLEIPHFQLKTEPSPFRKRSLSAPDFSEVEKIEYVPFEEECV